jgi:hypothetical protein
LIVDAFDFENSPSSAFEFVAAVAETTVVTEREADIMDKPGAAG